MAVEERGRGDHGRRPAPTKPLDVDEQAGEYWFGARDNGARLENFINFNERVLVMKLAIIGATGGIGRQLLERSLDAGHDVTVVVRDPSRLSRPASGVAVDLVHPDWNALETAMGGRDAVLSGLGPRSNSDVGV